MISFLFLVLGITSSTPSNIPSAWDMACHDTAYFASHFDLSKFEVYEPQYPESKLNDAATYRVVVRRPMVDVWNYFINGDPKVIWNSKPLKFRRAYSDGKLVSAPWIALRQNDKFFLDLELHHLGMTCRSMIGIEFTKVEAPQRIEFRYLDGTPNFGVQTVQLRTLPDGTTEILHESKYEGRNPFFGLFYNQAHTAALNGFYTALKTHLEN